MPTSTPNVSTTIFGIVLMVRSTSTVPSFYEQREPGERECADADQRGGWLNAVYGWLLGTDRVPVD